VPKEKGRSSIAPPVLPPTPFAEADEEPLFSTGFPASALRDAAHTYFRIDLPSPLLVTIEWLREYAICKRGVRWVNGVGASGGTPSGSGFVTERSCPDRQRTPQDPSRPPPRSMPSGSPSLRTDRQESIDTKARMSQAGA